MSLLPLLAPSALLLGSAAGSVGVSPEISGIVDGLADVSPEAAEQAVTAEGKAGVRAELPGVQRLVATLQEHLTAVQEQLLAALQDQQTEAQGQLTALQGKLTAVQEQLTTVREQQDTAQEQLTTVQLRLPPSPPSAGDCPAHWTRHSDSCYLISAVRATWLEAQQACAAFDRRARLVSIHASNKDHISGLLAAVGYLNVWIGLSRVPRHGWGWSDGTPVDYTDWLPGQPNSRDGTENCVYLYTGYDNQWTDFKCSARTAFMCQIRLI